MRDSARMNPQPTKEDSKRSYEEKYPRMSESRHEFELQDKSHASRMVLRLQDSWAEAVRQYGTSIDIETILWPITIQRNMLFLTLCSAVLYAIWSSAIVYGSIYTNQSHVYCLTNLHGFFFFVMVLKFKDGVNKQEKMIVGLMILGVILMVCDPWSYRVDAISVHNGKQYKKSQVMTDLLMIASNVVTAMFFMLNKVLIKDRAVKHFMILSFLIMLVTTVLAVMYDDAQLDFSPNKGLFGWLDSKLAFTTLFLNGFVATFLGTFGPILCMQFFTPV